MTLGRPGESGAREQIQEWSLLLSPTAGQPREDGSVPECPGHPRLGVMRGRAQAPHGHGAGAENTPFRFGVLTAA